MGSECGTWCAKHLLCLFNLLIFIFGTIVLGTGIWLSLDKASLIALMKLVENDKISEFTQPQVIDHLGYLLIVIGGIMVVMSFLGCLGAIRESRCLLMTYAILMILLLVAELVAGGLAAFYKDKVRDETKNYLQATINDYYSTSEQSNAVTLMWNGMMMELGCCGVNNYHDFETSSSWLAAKGNRTLPEYCCVLKRKEDDSYVVRDADCVTNPSESNSFYMKGCYEVLSTWIISHREYIIGVILGVGIICLFAIFLAIVLYKAYAKYHGMRL